MSNSCSDKCESCPVWKKSLFSDLDTESLKKLNGSKRLMVYKRNQFAFKQGEPTSGLHCIASGGFKILQDSGNGDSIVRVVSPGDTAGHRSLFIEDTYKGSAQAFKNSSACFIPIDTILDLLKRNTKFSLHLIKKLSSDINSIEKQNLDHKQKNVRERLATFIINYYDDFKDSDSNYVEWRLTRGEVATIVGAAEDTVIRLFSEFREEGWIQENGRELTLLNREVLSRIGLN